MLVCVAKGMTDVPDIPLEQIQQRVVAMWMGSFYGSSGYVARKLGTCSIGYQLLDFCEQICQSRHAKIIRINITNVLKKANF